MRNDPRNVIQSMACGLNPEASNKKMTNKNKQNKKQSLSRLHPKRRKKKMCAILKSFRELKSRCCCNGQKKVCFHKPRKGRKNSKELSKSLDLTFDFDQRWTIIRLRTRRIRWINGLLP